MGTILRKWAVIAKNISYVYPMSCNDY